MLLEKTQTLEDGIQELRAERAKFLTAIDNLQAANRQQAQTIIELAGAVQRYRSRALVIRQQAMRWREMHGDVVSEYISTVRRCGLLCSLIDDALGHIPAPHGNRIRRMLHHASQSNR
jgi:hypothetical protein